MSNLAYKIQQRNEEKLREQVQQRQVVIKKGRITAGERMLWIAAIVLFLIGSILVVSNYATIYTINKDIQVTDRNIKMEADKVSDLQLQVKELSEPERIRKIAEEQLGMTLDSKNVKVIN
jgi:cell division protein FtsL